MNGSKWIYICFEKYQSINALLYSIHSGRDLKSCQNCNCFFNADFKQVANLKTSGLMIYIHNNKSKQKRIFSDHSGSNIILHNTSNRDIKRFDYVVELCQYRTKCLRCRKLIQRVRDLIDEISIIYKNDVIGVCDFCKRSQKNKCKRCQHIVEKFMNNKAIENENRVAQFKLLLSKFQQILKSVLEAKVICKHNICLDSEYKSQLHRLLNSLNSPLPTRQSEIEEFIKLLQLKETGFVAGEIGQFLEDLVRQVKYKEIGENNEAEVSFISSGSESGCICKHFLSNKSFYKTLSSAEIPSQDKVSLRNLAISKDDENESTSMTSFKHLHQEKSKFETLTKKPSTKSELTEVSKKKQNNCLKSNKENELPNKSIKSSDNIKIRNNNEKISKNNMREVYLKSSKENELPNKSIKSSDNIKMRNNNEKISNNNMREVYLKSSKENELPNKSIKSSDNIKMRNNNEKISNNNMREVYLKSSKENELPNKSIKSSDNIKMRNNNEKISNNNMREVYLNSSKENELPIKSIKSSDNIKITMNNEKINNNNMREDYLKSNKENELPNKSIKSSNNLKMSNNNEKLSNINVKKGTRLNENEKKGIEKKNIQNEKKERQKEYREFHLMLKLLEKVEKEKKMYKILEKSKRKQGLPVIKDLPDLERLKRREKKKAENIETQSESILECKDNRLEVVTKMIKGTKIVNMHSNYPNIAKEKKRLPLLFKVKNDVIEHTNNRPSLSSSIRESTDRKNKMLQKTIPLKDSGIIRYELSNVKFIEKGWTKLPSTKIMRRMNIYKMLPASDKFDWFQNYRKEEYLFYHTGEKFAEINDSGGGKWFYKNGNVALDGHRAEDSNVLKRYVVYSSGEEIVTGKKEPITILACFDYYGNGVVYDCYGNVRLKYNQSEGVLIDKNIASPCRWKWHTLNDPPVLEQVFFNTCVNSTQNEWLKNFNTASEGKITDEEMIAIEFDNFVKEKTNKLMQKFKPFQIRIKVLKINDLFSLRIIDQANIFLLFRCDGIYFKINIGMLLKSDEIIDTDIAETSEVSTPYDKFPPKSPSLININNTIRNVRKFYGSSKKNK